MSSVTQAVSGSRRSASRRRGRGKARLKALVTDGEVRSVVAGIRGLGRAGIDVVVTASTRTAAGGWSRYATRRALIPSSRTHPRDFVGGLATVADRHVPVVVFPGVETSVDAVARRAMWLPSGATLATPDADVLERLRDKTVLMRSAQRVALETPRTFYVGCARGLSETAAPAPCLVKPARPSEPPGAAQVARSSEDLRAIAESLPPHARVLVQERVEGGLMAVAVVLDRQGCLVARFQQQALRTFPADAGVSALAVGVRPNEDLVERAAQLLRSAGFWGLAQLQFIRAGERHVLIDVNPRFFGSLPLALASGVNLPAAWYAVAVGAPAGRPAPYSVGIRYRWLEGEAVLARAVGWRRLRPMHRPIVGAVWAHDDPVPGLILGSQAVGVRLRRKAQRLR